MGFSEAVFASVSFLSPSKIRHSLEEWKQVAVKGKDGRSQTEDEERDGCQALDATLVFKHLKVAVDKGIDGKEKKSNKRIWSMKNRNANIENAIIVCANIQNGRNREGQLANTNGTRDTKNQVKRYLPHCQQRW